MAKELSIFVDESGDRGGKARYYLLTLVFHDQADSIAEAVTGYEAKLARADLPNIPFHSEPLMNGHKDYEFLGIEQRKAMLAYFSSFVRKLPISYTTLIYRRSQFEDPARLMERMSPSLRLLQVCKLPLRFRTCGGSGDVALTEEELGAVFPFGEQSQMSLSLLFLGRM